MEISCLHFIFLIFTVKFFVGNCAVDVSESLLSSKPRRMGTLTTAEPSRRGPEDV